MEEMPTCRVDFKLNNKSIYAIDPEFNETELIALRMSKTIYIGNRYYDIESISYNMETSRLEVWLKE